MILAASVQQAVGLIIILAMVAGLLVYFLVENKVSTTSNVDSFLNAPNRKQAPDDDVFEGPRLDRFLSWALVAMTIVAMSIPIYWLGEVGRQEGAVRGFDKRSVNRGEEAYYNEPNTKEGAPAFNCAACHAPNGGGGAAPWNVNDYNADGTKMMKNGKVLQRPVSWTAPRLTDVALRYQKGQLKNVLIYGRGENKPMPAWGIAGGGPATDQTINDIIQYLRHLALEKDPVARIAYETTWDKTKDADLAFEAAIKAGGDKRRAESEESLVAARKLDSNKGKSDGQILYESNCARCHTAGYSYGEPKQAGSGWFGPALNSDSLKKQFPDAASQAAFIKLGVADQKAYGTGGVNGWDGGGMPYFENVLTDKMIEAIVAYERGLEQ